MSTQEEPAVRKTTAAEMLLRILHQGEHITHDGSEYALDIEGGLCVVMRSDKGEEIPMRMDCDLRNFHRMAEDIGRDELWLRCCALMLQR